MLHGVYVLEGKCQGEARWALILCVVVRSGLGDLNEGNEPCHPLGNVLPRQEDSSRRIPEEGGAEHSRSSRNPCGRNWESRAGVGDRWGLAGGSLGQYPSVEGKCWLWAGVLPTVPLAAEGRGAPSAEGGQGSRAVQHMQDPSVCPRGPPRRY